MASFLQASTASTILQIWQDSRHFSFRSSSFVSVSSLSCRVPLFLDVHPPPCPGAEHSLVLRELNEAASAFPRGRSLHPAPTPHPFTHTHTPPYHTPHTNISTRPTPNPPSSLTYSSVFALLPPWVACSLVFFFLDADAPHMDGMMRKYNLAGRCSRCFDVCNGLHHSNVTFPNPTRT